MAIFGLDILMSKLDALLEILIGDGYDAEIIGRINDLPLLQCYLRQSGGDEMSADILEITYLPANEETLDEFGINFHCLLDVQGRNYQVLQAACDAYNSVTTGGFGYLSDEGRVLNCRSVLPEAGIPIEADVFLLFVKMFHGSLLTLKEMVFGAEE